MKYRADTRSANSSVAFFLETHPQKSFFFSKKIPEWMNKLIYSLVYSFTYISHMMFSVYFFFHSCTYLFSFNWSIRVDGDGARESRLIWLHQYSFFWYFSIVLFIFSCFSRNNGILKEMRWPMVIIKYIRTKKIWWYLLKHRGIYKIRYYVMNIIINYTVYNTYVNDSVP